jgi:hypothetical protein
MRLTWRDGLATAFVAAAAGLYAVWATGAGSSGTSARMVGAVVFGLGWAACTSDKDGVAVVYGPAPRGQRLPMSYVAATSLLGLVALVAGVATIASASGSMLAVLVAAMVTLWAMSTIRHALRSTRDDGVIQQPMRNAA